MKKRLLVLLCVVCWTVQISDAEQPNLLFIAVDDLRCDLGCYGNRVVKSPNIDRFATTGVLFKRAYCQQAVCNPSRVSLMTGLRPDATRVWDLTTEMRTVLPDVVTLPQHFRQNGCRAVAFGKIYHNPFPEALSWDEPTHNPQGVVAHSVDNKRCSSPPTIFCRTTRRSSPLEIARLAVSTSFGHTWTMRVLPAPSSAP